MNETIHNEAELEGTVLQSPVFSHENHGVRFDRFVLGVPRLSGQLDRLPVLLSSQLSPQVHQGEPLRLRGQLRSFNNHTGQGSRLILAVYVTALEPPQGSFDNHIFLSGMLCKPPTLRRTPLGRSICDLMMAVPRRYGRTDYLPVIAWGQLAAILSRRAVGDHVAVTGRVQSRLYTKLTDEGSEERTAYEVSVMQLPEEE